MKKIYLLAISLCSLFFVQACSNKSSVPSDKQEMLKKPEIGDDVPTDVATSIYDKAPITKEGVPQFGEMEEDCHGKRKVTQNLEDVNGSILNVGGLYVITTEGGNNRYNPCELSNKFKKDGIQVRFSGDVLEIFSNERLVASPFRLKNIVERDD